METTPPSASFFAQISQELMQLGEEIPTLQSVVEHAVEVVPACDWASVTLRRRRNRTETVAASSDVLMGHEEPPAAGQRRTGECKSRKEPVGERVSSRRTIFGPAAIAAAEMLARTMGARA